MTIKFLKPFVKDYTKLPSLQRRKTDEQLEHLKQNIRHPALKAHKMSHREEIWEARIDYHYRMTFNVKGSIIIMRRVGTHEIYRKP